MKVKVYRYNSSIDFTDSLMFVDGKAQCFGIEDEQRNVKVYGETRIPDGLYEIKLRKVGGFHRRYSKKFPSMHVGMLHIVGVPNFKNILIHIGNDDDDTDGCYLVGMSQNMNSNGFLGESTKAYKKIYPIISRELVKNQRVTIEFKSLNE